MCQCCINVLNIMKCNKRKKANTAEKLSDGK